MTASHKAVENPQILTALSSTQHSTMPAGATCTFASLSTFYN